jgi:FG-GAP repeat
VHAQLRFASILTVIGLITAVAAPSAVAEPPAGWDSQAIDNPTPTLNDRFGDGVVNVGDLDADGEDDFLVGIDEHGMISGKLHVFSGADGSLIYTVLPPDPDAGGSGDNPDAFGTFVGRIGTNRSGAPFTDIGQCPGGAPGANCGSPQGTIDTPDGVPDILASAVGVDVDANGDDMGMVYVLDGATGAVLKRIVMPAGDRAEQAQNSPTASQGGAFGRTVISPSGQPPCDGFGGIGSCPYGATSAVAIGDLDGAGAPDVGVGASDFTDAGGGTSDAAAENPLCTLTCFQTGRYYVFRGEDLAGLAPGTPLSTPLYKLKNPFAADDLPTQNSRFHREAMGYSIEPVGDLGKCNNTTPIAATDSPSTYLCLNTANTTTPDGKPEFILSDHRVDANGLGDVGLAMAIDGATGRVLDIYNHPEPQQSAIFAFSNYNQPAIGDVGSSTAPDVYQGAMVQDVAKFAQGEGYVLSGDFRSGGANHYRISTLDDPTPNKVGNFGTSSAGVGNVSGDSRNEIMIGAYGPHAPQVIDDVISDVHIFDPQHDEALRTIPDPDQQAGSGFGRALAPLGDLNEDGFLDFVVGAGGFGPGSCSPCPPTGTEPAQGRVYLFTSNDVAARAVTVDASKKKVKKHKPVELSGSIDAVANEEECEPSQTVDLQRRKPGSGAFTAFTTAKTREDGSYSAEIRPRKTREYRASLDASAKCEAAVSDAVKVKVKKKRKR